MDARCCWPSIIIFGGWTEYICDEATWPDDDNKLKSVLLGGWVNGVRRRCCWSPIDYVQCNLWLGRHCTQHHSADSYPISVDWRWRAERSLSISHILYDRSRHSLYVQIICNRSKRIWSANSYVWIKMLIESAYYLKFAQFTHILIDLWEEGSIAPACKWVYHPERGAYNVIWQECVPLHSKYSSTARTSQTAY